MLSPPVPKSTDTHVRVVAGREFSYQDWTRLTACDFSHLLYPSVPRQNFRSGGPGPFYAEVYCRLPKDELLCARLLAHIGAIADATDGHVEYYRSERPPASW